MTDTRQTLLADAQATPEAARTELTATDRCDRCAAAARVIATLPSGGELLFCQHHFNEHQTRLEDMNASILIPDAVLG